MRPNQWKVCIKNWVVRWSGQYFVIFVNSNRNLEVVIIFCHNKVIIGTSFSIMNFVHENIGRNFELRFNKEFMSLAISTPIVKYSDNLNFSIESKDLSNALVKDLETSLSCKSSSIVKYILKRGVTRLTWDVTWHIWTHSWIIESFESLINLLILLNHLIFVPCGSV